MNQLSLLWELLAGLFLLGSELLLAFFFFWIVGFAIFVLELLGSTIEVLLATGPIAVFYLFALFWIMRALYRSSGRVAR